MRLVTRKRRESINLDLLYFDGDSDPSRGMFVGGVAEPEATDELAIWVHEGPPRHFGLENSESDSAYQVELTGTRRRLFELGRYLIALSRYETEDPDYHDHFDELAEVRDAKPCVLIVRGPREV